MKEFTLGKSLTSVSTVASVLVMQDTLRDIKEFTLGKSLMSVNSVANVLVKQQT